MNKKVTIIVALICCALVAGGAAYFILNDEKKGPPTINEEAAIYLLESLNEGKYENFYDYMYDGKNDKAEVEKIADLWKNVTKSLGDFQSIERVNVVEEDFHYTYDLYCVFERGAEKIRVDFTSYLLNVTFEGYNQDIFDKIPAGLKEIDVKVNAGKKWELNGKITTNADGKNDTAVVIVHGSGPMDMDGTAYGNKLYRDFAWGLAQYGIDVIRYDKRTYVYGNSSADDIRKFTVKEETIDDAIAAAKLLKARGYDKVYLVGHSMGGMLAPAIVKESNGLFDGFVSLAGSPRTMPEIQADQNLAFATPENQDLVNLLVQAELAKLEKLDTWTEAELLSNTIFGLPAYYVKDMISRGAGDIAASLDVPMLFLQGSADFQIYADKDYALWKEILKEKEGASFRLYNGLNHMFMLSQGDDAGAVGEYYLRGHVDPKVIRDIADFVKRKVIVIGDDAFVEEVKATLKGSLMEVVSFTSKTPTKYDIVILDESWKDRPPTGNIYNLIKSNIPVIATRSTGASGDNTSYNYTGVCGVSKDGGTFGDYTFEEALNITYRQVHYWTTMDLEMGVYGHEPPISFPG
jgi:pimeloyl-ACP methyl ester carboxylesterase